MEKTRSYRRRGTPDNPIAVYWAIAGVNMRQHHNAEYHPETEIILVSQGNLTLIIGGESKTFSTGDICIIPPNVVHWRTNYSEDAIVWTIVFSTEAIRLPPESFFQKGFVQPLSEGRLEVPTLLQPDHPAYDEVFEQMSQLESCRIIVNNYRHHRLRILMSICLALMPYCQILPYGKIAPEPGHDAVKHCMEYIYRNFDKKLTLDAIAQHCHLHPNYLCNVFKQYTGETVFEYRTRIRIESAAAMLLQEKLPVRKVAELTGFRSECQFYQKFKQHTGMTPKNYVKTAMATQPEAEN